MQRGAHILASCTCATYKQPKTCARVEMECYIFASCTCAIVAVVMTLKMEPQTRKPFVVDQFGFFVMDQF